MDKQGILSCLDTGDTLQTFTDYQKYVLTAQPGVCVKHVLHARYLIGPDTSRGRASRAGASTWPCRRTT
jgi:hypothetical protein